MIKYWYIEFLIGLENIFWYLENATNRHRRNVEGDTPI